jgi:hypothetical protein
VQSDDLRIFLAVAQGGSQGDAALRRGVFKASRAALRG